MVISVTMVTMGARVSACHLFLGECKPRSPLVHHRLEYLQFVFATSPEELIPKKRMHESQYGNLFLGYLNCSVFSS